ncbi:MAG: hypothetical protein JWN46_1224 [Acidimicrobiales bacterium]|nr:hypothetical protein [Acidimicrobiales bacterium]
MSMKLHPEVDGLREDAATKLDELSALVPFLLGKPEDWVRKALAARMPWFTPSDSYIAQIVAGKRPAGP